MQIWSAGGAWFLYGVVALGKWLRRADLVGGGAWFLYGVVALGKWLRRADLVGGVRRPHAASAGCKTGPVPMIDISTPPVGVRE